MNTSTQLAALALCLGCASAAPAQGTGAASGSTPAMSASATAGIVKNVVGNVQLQRPGQAPKALAVGQALQPGDALSVGRDSSAGITLSDDTLLSAGPDSQLVIDTYAFDPTTQEGNILLKLWNGTLKVVTGLIGKKAPEKVNVQTRTVVLGVRGTEFIIETHGVAP